MKYENSCLLVQKGQLLSLRSVYALLEPGDTLSIVRCTVGARVQVGARDITYILDTDPKSNRLIFKDDKAFNQRSYGVAYISELEFEDINKPVLIDVNSDCVYSFYDLLDLCDNDVCLTEHLYDNLEGERPERVIPYLYEQDLCRCYYE